MRFRVVNLDGDTIALDHRDSRIHEAVTLEGLLPDVATAMNWPVSHICLVVDNTIVKYIHRISERKRTRLLDLCSVGTECIVQAIKIGPPDKFLPEEVCICDFGGCCCECMVASNRPCEGCGNDGCCRTGNCGHSCCESRCFRGEASDLTLRCLLEGCKPWWDQYPQSSGEEFFMLQNKNRLKRMCSNSPSPYRPKKCTVKAQAIPTFKSERPPKEKVRQPAKKQLK